MCFFAKSEVWILVKHDSNVRLNVRCRMSEQGSSHQLGLQLPQKRLSSSYKIAKKTSFTFIFLSIQKLIQYKCESSGLQHKCIDQAFFPSRSLLLFVWISVMGLNLRLLFGRKQLSYLEGHDIIDICNRQMIMITIHLNTTNF